MKPVSPKAAIASSMYNSIRNSAVSWRRKSSYRKKIKRVQSKITRQFLKLYKNQIFD